MQLGRLVASVTMALATALGGARLPTSWRLRPRTTCDEVRSSPSLGRWAGRICNEPIHWCEV
jgi:hypothetical protein